MAKIWSRTTTSFLDFSPLENTQATHEHTEQPTTQLGSVSFVDAIVIIIIIFIILILIVYGNDDVSDDDNDDNIIGDELLLNFGAKFLR